MCYSLKDWLLPQHLFLCRSSLHFESTRSGFLVIFLRYWFSIPKHKKTKYTVNCFAIYIYYLPKIRKMIVKTKYMNIPLFFSMLYSEELPLHFHMQMIILSKLWHHCIYVVFVFRFKCVFPPSVCSLTASPSMQLTLLRNSIAV